MANQVLPKVDAPPYGIANNYVDPAPEYSPPRGGAGPSFNQPAPPYSAPSLPYYTPNSHFDYSQHNPYTINQPDPGFYPMHPTGPVNTSSTTVVIQQPISALGPNGRRLWASGICECCNDMQVCCCGTFCYHCLACQVSTDMGESFCVPCLVLGWLTVLRTKMRLQHNIAGSVLDDCCTATCCSPCTLCQLARELKLYRTRGHMIQ